tara:strand:- start:17 stop:640 length:624 start_codon:yes stop_codon:yes gene_type:complete
MKFKLTLFLILVSFSFSNNNTKFGIGAEFQLFPSVLFSDNNAPNLDIYFPIKASGITIEPQISFSRIETEVDYDTADSWYSSYNDYTSTITNTSLIIGVLKRLSKGKVESYAGIRIGRITTKAVTQFENPTIEDIENEDEALIFSPIFGAEYFVGEDISLGLEAIYNTIKTDDDGDNNYDWMPPNIRTETTESTLIPKLIIRFYFSN